ncbi:unnamed protein product [Linum trigynum]|uniref:Protein kinase domain-containing protein n=1 Tax=Linum trigynum TaxID=586398 RepID=A0AAV2D124_9ROSI
MISMNLPYQQQIITTTMVITSFVIIFGTTPSSITALSFTLVFPTLGQISFQRAQETDHGSIQLTRNLLDADQSFHFGRATSAYHLRLWDGDRRASFDTSFSFTVFSPRDDKGGIGGGMAFFLAPWGSKLPPSKSGATLGLTADSPDQELNSTAGRFVAVEFDVFRDYFDPPGGSHVGINVDSMRSVATAPWAADTTGEKQSQAWISYDATSNNLSVMVTGFGDGGSLANKTIFHVSHIVDLKDYLPQSVTFGFSGSTGNRSASQSIHSWHFYSSLEIVPSGIPVFAGLLVGTALIFVISFICVALIDRTTNSIADDDVNADKVDELLGPRKFPFKELKRATNGFSDRDNKLGEGGFGRVYKGRVRLSDVAVKRVSRRSSQGTKEFAAEVKIISRLRHRNLVQLMGWCQEKKELLLVYEFMPNGTLDAHLFHRDNKMPLLTPPSLLGWGSRYKIAKGIASGLLYLHEEWEQCVVHRDIKSSNILLDSNFNPKLGDFGLARLVDHEKGSQTTILAGTMGYMAPECATTGKASRETDVYSFGVVALEIATGRRPAVIEYHHPDDDDEEAYAVHLVRWVWDLHGNGDLLNRGPDSRLGGEFEESEMERLMVIGMACAHPNPDFRLSARQALQVLNFDAPVPLLPLNMPVPTYVVSAPSSTNLSSWMPSGGRGSSGRTNEGFSGASTTTAPLRLNATRSEVLLVLPSSKISSALPVTV